MSSNKDNNKDQVKRIKGRKFSKYMKGPVKLLVKARDFYMQSMTQFSSVAGHGSAMGCPSGQIGSSLARSFSAGSTESRTKSEDYRELLRLASMRNTSGKIIESPAVVRRSFNVGIGRIDEEKECEFGDDDDVKLGSGLSSTISRGYTPLKRTRVS